MKTKQSRLEKQQYLPICFMNEMSKKITLPLNLISVLQLPSEHP